MKIAITGASGFLGQHVRFYLLPFEKQGEHSVVVVPKGAFGNVEKLRELVAPCDAVIHLAGMNQGDDADVYETNVRLARTLAEACGGARPHIVLASSTHIERDTAYGTSKKEAGDILQAWGAKNNARVSIAVLPHVFGEFAKPFYNSGVATLCHQIAQDLPPKLNPEAWVELIHARDVAHRLIDMLKTEGGVTRLEGRPIALSAVYEMLALWAQQYRSGVIPMLSDRFETALFMTLHSHLFPTMFPRSLEVKSDDRGSLFEVVRSAKPDLVFFSTTVPGATRGSHYHTRKFERFCVVRGEGRISLRKLLTNEIRTYDVSGEKPVVIDMPTYWTHALTNTGTGDLSAVFWISEHLDPSDPDTYHEPV
ncbi:MAG: NAD-dependent epimerase/dehydratase family protein [Patescibacteria group bacterium]